MTGIVKDDRAGSAKLQQYESLKIFPPLRLVACNPLIRQLESLHLGLAKVA
jgi:hypothetical protein